MQAPSKWVNYIVFFITSAHAVCTGDLLRVQSQEATQSTTEKFQASPSFYYYYQQHRGQPAQRIHIEYPQQARISSTPQTFLTSRPFSRFSSIKHESAAKIPSTPQPYVEYPVDDTEERQNTSNKLYFEDHNGNDTHREHHYRHVTVNHYYYNATNATEGSDPSKEKDVKHHYYYNEYKHDHRNKTEDPNVKYHSYYNEYKHDHRNKTEDPDVKHHYYYNEYKHDHRNKTEDPDVKHHYYYNEYKHDHRNKTEDPNVKHHYYYNEYKHDHRNKTEDPNVKHHYYYNEYKHDHRNKTDDPNVKHHYYNNEYKHDHRNKTDDPSVKHHYYNNEYKHDHRNKTDDPNVKHDYYHNEYKHDHRNKKDAQPGGKHYHKEFTHEQRNWTNNANGKRYNDDHRNKTRGGASVKHYYHATNRTVNRTEAPKVKHYYYKDDDNAEYSGQYDDYDESGGEDDAQKIEDELVAPITDAHGIEDYEYITPDPKPIVKHHHYYKEYHYKNGRLVANTTRAESPKSRPFRNFQNSYTPESLKLGRYVGFPVIPIIKDTSYDKRFAFVGGSGHPFFGWVKPHDDPSYRHRRPNPNGSSGYYLVDPLGQLPIFRIHTSLPESYPERTSSRVQGYKLESSYPEAVSYSHVTRVHPV